MTREEITELAAAPYAETRRKFLEKNAPDMLRGMEANGYLAEHLATVQELVDDYIDRRCEAVQKTDRYLKANALEQIRILQSEHIFARQDAFSMWVYSLP